MQEFKLTSIQQINENLVSVDFVGNKKGRIYNVYSAKIDTSLGLEKCKLAIFSVSTSDTIKPESTDVIHQNAFKNTFLPVISVEVKSWF